MRIITVVKTRFESNLYKYKSIREAFQLTLEQQGIQGLWRGFIPTGSGLRLLRKSLSSAIGWTLYGGLIKKWAIKT
ncbi:hypothetical protein MJO28_004458 [Puccinia striiformis f. sp. tritici]|uniref:Uncharacterized protein n=1 Tax=Puccinia striiformis f. sp. tritici TaxID=168172 RepID=A0ACC0ENT2_9BASI|nr:hypothetical protein MJO28_004458 [Puccinia striiformis f. sp. tritici]